jgi:hypothetical protein
MKIQPVNVSYRDAASKQKASLGSIDVEIPETIEEAIQLFGAEKFMTYAREHYILEQRCKAVREKRPRKTRIPKSPAGKFRQLSPEQQEELLKYAGVL